MSHQEYGKRKSAEETEEKGKEKKPKLAQREEDEDSSFTEEEEEATETDEILMEKEAKKLQLVMQRLVNQNLRNDLTLKALQIDYYKSRTKKN